MLALRPLLSGLAGVSGLIPVWLWQDQLAADEGNFSRSGGAGTVEGNGNRCAGAAPQAKFDDPGEIASPGRLAIDMGDDVSHPDPGLCCRTTAHQLPDLDFAVGPGYPVDADTAEIAG